MIDVDKISERLRNLRHDKNITQERLAEEIGMSVSTLSRLERGDRGYNLENIDVLCAYYGCSVDYLLYGNEDNEISIMLQRVEKSKQPLVIRLVRAIISEL